MQRLAAMAIPVASASAVSVPPARSAAAVSLDAEIDGVLQRLGRYVSEYGQQASLIVGIEHYTQHYENAPVGQPSDRQSTAEYALVKTARAAEWAGFRDVIELNGKPVPDRRDRLRQVFGAGTPDVSEARHIADESARFNIGPTRRNFNEPISALFFMLPARQPRFAFTRKGGAKLGGIDAWQIDFEEKSRPTIIRTSEGRDAPSRGTLWIVAADGTVVRTKLLLSGFAGVESRCSIDVAYRRDPRLGLWLPERMSEQYAAKVQDNPLGGRTATTAIVTATATYSNFKRFETGATMK